ncbi:hypothetical protein [Actinopolyspora alba]|nr:hypothetical protein [Actinopolyspora alba]
MALPLAIGGAGVASADDWKPEHNHGHKDKHKAEKCVYQSCKINSHKKKNLWLWGWKHYKVDSETSFVNVGIM